MKVFLINLDRHPDRRAFMEQQLIKLGIVWERISGVDGKILTAQELEVYDEDASIRINGIPLTRGHIGCSLSHVRLYERIVAEKIPRALIFEDDVVISNELVRIMGEAWVQSDSWDYVHLSYTPMSLSWLSSWLRASWKQTLERPWIVLYMLLKIPYMLLVFFYEIVQRSVLKHTGSKYVRFFRPLYHTGAYCISYTGAQKLLSMAYPIRYAADRLPNQARVRAGLRFFGYCPVPVRTSNQFGSNTV